LLALAGASQANAAMTWNIANSLSGTPTATIVNTPWTMIRMSSPTCNAGAVVPLTAQYTNGTQIGGRDGLIATDQPIVAKNLSSTTAVFAGNVTVPAGAVLMHPGPQNECAIARFTVPSNQPNNGTYTVTASFVGAYNGTKGPGDGVKGMVLKNGVVMGTPVDTATPGGGSVSFTTTLRRGDKVDCAVHMKAYFQYDSTLVACKITGPNPRDKDDDGHGDGDHDGDGHGNGQPPR
jgi:hypothetical protein